MSTQVVQLKVYNPDYISVYDIERLINDGYRFDIVDGLQENEYDVLEEKEACDG